MGPENYFSDSDGFGVLEHGEHGGETFSSIGQREVLQTECGVKTGVGPVRKRLSHKPLRNQKKRRHRKFTVFGPRKLFLRFRRFGVLEHGEHGGETFSSIRLREVLQFPIGTW